MTSLLRGRSSQLTLDNTRGCISGAQLQGVQDLAKNNDHYNWDAIDGYDELGYDVSPSPSPPTPTPAGLAWPRPGPNLTMVKA